MVDAHAFRLNGPDVGVGELVSEADTATGQQAAAADRNQNHVWLHTTGSTILPLCFRFQGG